MEIYLEIGKKRTFAGAVDWPGWCRSGRDEASALQALYAYGARYAAVLQESELEFTAPTAPTAFAIVERLEGNASTDFGAPNIPLAGDAAPVGQVELARFLGLLRACWSAFDAAAADGQGVALRTGPRGGGRALERIVQHVVEADAAYLKRLNWKYRYNETAGLPAELARSREAIEAALSGAVNDGLPAQGPRGGKIWSPRQFVRRVAWHVLDHAWEIEDRAG